jgi:hypothetical protein
MFETFTPRLPEYVQYVPDRWYQVADLFEDETDVPLMVQPELTDTQVALLHDTLRFISEHPEKHNQTIWIDVPGVGFIGEGEIDARDGGVYQQLPELGSVDNCGVTGCLAGWVVLRSDTPIVRNRFGSVWPAKRNHNGEWVAQDVAEVALKTLGLSTENERLFDGDNTLADLWRMAEIITEGRIKTPEKFLR